LVAGLGKLDAALPCALVVKARVRANLAQACQEFEGGGLLHKAEELYCAAIDETIILMGEKGRRHRDNLQRRLEQVRDNLD